MSLLIQRSGDFVYFLRNGQQRASLQKDVTMNLSNNRQGIVVVDAQGNSFIINYQEVTFTQVLPAPALPFSGTLVDLWDLLKLSFFNELHASIVGTVTSDDVTNLSGVAGATVTDALNTLNGKYIFPKIEFSGVWNISGVVTPAAMGATENDYNPAGFVDNTIVRLSPNNPRTIITGFAAPLGGEAPVKVIHNINQYQIRLAPNSILSAPNNRIEISANLNINEFESAYIWYDQLSLKWKVLSNYQ
jgi:hypothetical protein